MHIHALLNFHLFVRVFILNITQKKESIHSNLAFVFPFKIGITQNAYYTMYGFSSHICHHSLVRQSHDTFCPTNKTSLPGAECEKYNEKYTLSVETSDFRSVVKNFTFLIIILASVRCVTLNSLHQFSIQCNRHLTFL